MKTQNNVSGFMEYSICTKCNWNHVPPKPPTTKYDTEKNLLIRTCLNCGYEWMETPADTPPPETPKPSNKKRSRWKEIEINKK